MRPSHDSPVPPWPAPGPGVLSAAAHTHADPQAPRFDERATAADSSPDETGWAVRGIDEANQSRKSSVRSLFSVPSGLRGASTAPTLSAVAGVALVAALIAVVLMGRWWWQAAESKEQRVPAASIALSTANPSATGSALGDGARLGTHGTGAPAIPPASEAPTSGGVEASPQATIVVHVAGKVRKPGVVRLASGARVVDAVGRAGGMAPDADTATVNLARPVVDGEQIVVLGRGEKPTAVASGAAQSGAPGAAAGGAASGSAAAGGKVDLNRADQAELETLPGVGPVLAGRIIEWRTRNGRFTSVDELSEVSGVGDKTLARLTPLVTV
ncbi:MAG: ComEA family DNA-binding protein [Dermatophilus congolensis]|nr:ComEA family DNA-binding protein [Dermatophilus congolensis]